MNLSTVTPHAHSDRGAHRRRGSDGGVNSDGEGGATKSTDPAPLGFRLPSLLSAVPVAWMWTVAVIIAVLSVGLLDTSFNSSQSQRVDLTLREVARRVSRRINFFASRACGARNMWIRSLGNGTAQPLLLMESDGLPAASAFMSNTLARAYTDLLLFDPQSFAIWQLLFLDGSVAVVANADLLALPSAATQGDVTALGYWSIYNASLGALTAYQFQSFTRGSRVGTANVSLAILSYEAAYVQDSSGAQSNGLLLMNNATLFEDVFNQDDGPLTWLVGQPVVFLPQTTIPVLPLYTGVYNISGHLVGVETVMTQLTDIQSLLTVPASINSNSSSDGEAASVAFLLDQSELVFGSSLSVPQLALSSPSAFCEVPTTAVANFLAVGCMYRAAAFPFFPPLADAAAQPSFTAALNNITASAPVPLGNVDGYTVSAIQVYLTNAFLQGVTTNLVVVLFTPQPALALAITAEIVGLALLVASVASLALTAAVWRLTAPIMRFVQRLTEQSRVMKQGPDHSDSSVPAPSPFDESRHVASACDRLLATRAITSRYVPRGGGLSLNLRCDEGEALLLHRTVLRRVTGTVAHFIVDDFTTLSTSLSRAGLNSPDLFLQTVASVCDLVARVVARHDGVIQRVAGDAITAVWCTSNYVPNHETKATISALLAARSVPVVANPNKKSERASFELRCGVCSGEMFCGAVDGGAASSSAAPLFVVYGTPVRLAARLAALSEQRTCNVRVLISHITFAAIPPKLVVCCLVNAIDVEDIAVDSTGRNPAFARTATYNGSFWESMHHSGLTYSPNQPTSPSAAGSDAPPSPVAAVETAGVASSGMPALLEFGRSMVSLGYLPVYAALGIMNISKDVTRTLTMNDYAVPPHNAAGLQSLSTDASLRSMSHSAGGGGKAPVLHSVGIGTPTILLAEEAVSRLAGWRVASTDEAHCADALSDAALHHLTDQHRTALMRIDTTPRAPAHPTGLTLRQVEAKERNTRPLSATTDEEDILDADLTNSNAAVLPSFSQQLKLVRESLRAAIVAALESSSCSGTPTPPPPLHGGTLQHNDSFRRGRPRGSFVGLRPSSAATLGQRHPPPALTPPSPAALGRITMPQFSTEPPLTEPPPPENEEDAEGGGGDIVQSEGRAMHSITQPPGGTECTLDSEEDLMNAATQAAGGGSRDAGQEGNRERQQGLSATQPPMDASSVASSFRGAECE